MSIVNFTVHYDDLSNDIDDTAAEINTAAHIGPVRFTTQISPGARVPAPEYNPRPTGFGFRVFSGYLDTDGRLKNKRGGTPGVKLWANDPVFTGLPRLEYRVQAELTDALGRPVLFDGFNFDAPGPDHPQWPDVEVDLAREMPQPGQKFGRGRPGFGVRALEIDNDALLVVTRDDLAEFDPIAIPESAALTVAYALTFGR